MGFRFRRSIKLLPGVKINLGKTGPSISVGPRGAKVTIGKTGVRETVGIPSTGLSYTNHTSFPKDNKTAISQTDQQPHESPMEGANNNSGCGCVSLLILLCMAFGLYLILR